MFWLHGDQSWDFTATRVMALSIMAFSVVIVGDRNRARLGLGDDIMVFLTAAWRNLAMVSWPVDQAMLADLIPPGTELDDFHGTTYVSLVGFRFHDTRVLGLSLPYHRCFDELNLRFYVRRRTATGFDRGVSFIRELVPRRLIAWVARSFYQEPYAAVPMESTLHTDAGMTTVEYRWWIGRWNRLAMTVTGVPDFPVSTGLDAWIAEHYWGYTRQRNSTSLAYRVEHPPWRTQQASQHLIDADIAQTYGPTWTTILQQPPASAFLAEGSPITVSRPMVVSAGAAP